MKIVFLSVAELELVSAIQYYEEKEVGLGLRFYAEIKSTLNRILTYSQAWRMLSLNTRRCRTKVFPYGVIYEIRTDEILIIAVAHLHRKPEYWKSRLN